MAVYGAHEDQVTRLSTPSEALLFDCTVSPLSVPSTNDSQSQVRSNAFAGAACWDRGHISMQHCTVADNRGAGFDMLTKVSPSPCLPVPVLFFTNVAFSVMRGNRVALIVHSISVYLRPSFGKTPPITETRIITSRSSSRMAPGISCYNSICCL